MPDAATDTMGQNAPITPQPVQTDNTPAPNISAVPTNVSATPSAVSDANVPRPLPPPQKESFSEGFKREANPQYTTDAEGNVIRSEPAVRRSVKGVLGSILAGALEGAARGMAATTPEGAEGAGGAASAGMNAAIQGRIEADKRARAIAQQNFLNKQAATAAKIKNNLDLAQIAHITQVMNFEKEQEPGVLRAQQLGNEAAAMKLEGGQQQLLKDSLEFQHELVTKGQLDPQFFQIYNEHTQELNAQASSLVGGSVKAFQNGKRGDENGVILIPTDIMKGAIIPKNVNMIYNTYGQLDSKGRLIPGSVAYTKDGTPIPTANAMTGDGKLSLLDYNDKYMIGQRELYQAQQQILSDLTLQQQKATVKKTQAEGEKARAEAVLAEYESGAGGGAGDRTKTGDAYVDTLPPMNQDIVHGLLRYQMKPTDLGRSKDRKILIAEAIHADPSWSEAQYEERYNFLKEYGDTQKGAGATRDRINTAVGHLDMLSHASDALAGRDVKALNSIAQAIGVQTGNSPRVVYDAIANKAAAEAAAAMKGGGAAPTDTDIENARKSFEATLAPQIRKANIQAQYGLLKTQVDTVAGHFQQVMKQTPDEFGQPVLYPQNQEILNRWMSPAKSVQFAPVPQGVVPQGATPFWSKTNGAFLGYQTPEQAKTGTYTPYQNKGGVSGNF